MYIQDLEYYQDIKIHLILSFVFFGCYNLINFLKIYTVYILV
jgi:hypothetical protein